MRRRRVTPEWLDRLSAEDPDAIRSRADLRRLNRLMGHPGLVVRAVRRGFSGRPIRRIVDLGGGDGFLLSRVARRLSGTWPGVNAVIVDRAVAVGPDTRAEIESCGWSLSVHEEDVFLWLQRWMEPIDLVVSNLFLHHFRDDDVTRLLTLIHAKARMFMSFEPRRSRLALNASRLVGLVGCNRVTRHDAVVSVQAGFRKGELPGLWPTVQGAADFGFRDEYAGLFSHLFVARGAGVSPEDRLRPDNATRPVSP